MQTVNGGSEVIIEGSVTFRALLRGSGMRGKRHSSSAPLFGDDHRRVGQLRGAIARTTGVLDKSTELSSTPRHNVAPSRRVRGRRTCFPTR
jgi:hypothetical protein